MSITAHQAKIKGIVAIAGMNVSPGEVLRRSEKPTICPSVLVKLADGDHYSLGMSLVKEQNEFDDALNKALEHSQQVIVEKFIEPGKDIRCRIIVNDGTLIIEPFEEYRTDGDQRPVRTCEEKFPEFDANGNFIGWPEYDQNSHWMNKDNNDHPTTTKIHQAARKCHLALDCYLDPHGKASFIETGLFCSSW